MGFYDLEHFCCNLFGLTLQVSFPLSKKALSIHDLI